MSKSARQGSKRSQYSLGVFYEEGIGVSRDLEKAVYWYKLASRQGYSNATKRLAMLESDGDGDTLIAGDISLEEALTLAVSSDDINAAEKSLRAGANVNATDEFRRTVLFEAVNRKNVKMVKLLLDNGADADVVDSYKDRPLMLAASNGETAIVGELIKHQASVGHKDANGNTALMLASAKGNKDIVAVLLRDKASHQPKNRNGENAIVMAAKGNHKSTVKLLEKYGARLPVERKDGLTAKQKLAAMNTETSTVYKNWSPLGARTHL